MNMDERGNDEWYDLRCKRPSHLHAPLDKHIMQQYNKVTNTMKLFKKKKNNSMYGHYYFVFLEL
jgi:hypothetical protein